MKIIDPGDPAFSFWHPRPTRRKFLGTMGLAAAGVLFSRYGLSNKLIKLPGILKTGRSNMVASTIADNYETTYIRDKIEYLFNCLGGIGDVVKPGDKVGIKINLTGGSGWANDPNLDGVDIRECAWTHPEVLRAVGELLIDSGVNGNDIYIVEGLWDDACFYQYGYSDVMSYLGAQVVNLNIPAPYPAFINKSTGSDYFYYASFTLNQILNDIDVFVSIPKMKQHATAGVTHSMKNLIGIAPLDAARMMVLKPYGREWLHSEGGEEDWYHLPRSICDLNMARPIHLAVIDGIKNAVGGEGPWNPTFEPHEDHFLLAGKNSVSTDSVCSYIMGNNPEPEQFLRPDGTNCDNHLYLASQKGMGTNIMSEIELVGDGAGYILGVDENENPAGISPIRLYQNQPNPFRSSTRIRFFLKDGGHVSLMIFNDKGQEISRLVNGHMSSGEHDAVWNAIGQPAGIYLARLSVDGYSEIRKLKLVY